MVLLFLVLMLFLNPISESFPLQIDDMDVLIFRLHGQKLSLNLDLGQENVGVEDLESASLSVLRDGDICHTFDEQLPKVIFFLPASCTADHRFWFSVMLVIKDKYLSSTAVLIPPASRPRGIDSVSQLTLVLPLTLDDIPRASVLMSSLSHLRGGVISELLIFVPEYDWEPIKLLLKGFSSRVNFPITIHSENMLLLDEAARSDAFPYAKQMAIKILAAEMVFTEYYITLDADLISLKSASFVDFIDERGRAKFDYESRTIHESWWEGSETFLRILLTPQQKEKQGFGVTPAVLSTYGSLLALARIRQLYSDGGDAVRYWITSFGHSGVIWSEYTIYRIVLDYYHVFNDLHFPSVNGDSIHCFDVWYSTDLPWDGYSAVCSQCLFSVIQSSTGISASSLLIQYENTRSMGCNSQ